MLVIPSSLREARRMVADPAEINRKIPQESFTVFQIQIPPEPFFDFRDITIRKIGPDRVPYGGLQSEHFPWVSHE